MTATTPPTTRGHHVSNGADRWRQVGTAIDLLNHALVVCPGALWTQCLWHDPLSPAFPLRFWHVIFHALV